MQITCKCTRIAIELVREITTERRFNGGKIRISVTKTTPLLFFGVDWARRECFEEAFVKIIPLSRFWEMIAFWRVVKTVSIVGLWSLRVCNDFRSWWNFETSIGDLPFCDSVENYANTRGCLNIVSGCEKFRSVCSKWN